MTGRQNTVTCLHERGLHAAGRAGPDAYGDFLLGLHLDESGRNPDSQERLSHQSLFKDNIASSSSSSVNGLLSLRQ